MNTNMFLLSQKQTNLARSFRKHACTITYEGAIGGKLTYSFTPTSVLQIIKIECVCGAGIDLTDYEEF